MPLRADRCAVSTVSGVGSSAPRIGHGPDPRLRTTSVGRRMLTINRHPPGDVMQTEQDRGRRIDRCSFGAVLRQCRHRVGHRTHVQWPERAPGHPDKRLLVEAINLSGIGRGTDGRPGRHQPDVLVGQLRFFPKLRHRDGRQRRPRLVLEILATFEGRVLPMSQPSGSLRRTAGHDYQGSTVLGTRRSLLRPYALVRRRQQSYVGASGRRQLRSVSNGSFTADATSQTPCSSTVAQPLPERLRAARPHVTGARAGDGWVDAGRSCGRRSGPARPEGPISCPRAARRRARLRRRARRR